MWWRQLLYGLRPNVATRRVVEPPPSFKKVFRFFGFKGGINNGMCQTYIMCILCFFLMLLTCMMYMFLLLLTCMHFSATIPSPPVLFVAQESLFACPSTFSFSWWARSITFVADWMTWLQCQCRCNSNMLPPLFSLPSFSLACMCAAACTGH